MNKNLMPAGSMSISSLTKREKAALGRIIAASPNVSKREKSRLANLLAEKPSSMTPRNTR